MFGRYKTAKKDFSNDSLPSTRREQFFDYLRNQKLTMLKIGLILLLFAVPYISILIYQQISYINLNELYSSNSISLEEMNSSYLIINLITNGLKFLAIAVLSVGIAGVIKIYRNLCWNEGVFMFDDFKEGVKENYKQTLLTSIIGFIFIFIAYLFKDIAHLLGNNLLGVGEYLSLGIGIIVIIPLCLFMYSQISCYKCKMSLLITNSFSLLIAKFIYLLVFSVIFSLLLGCFIFIPVPLNIFVLILIIVLFLPYLILAFHLFSIQVFDDFINDQYPDYLRKGLRK